MKIIESFVHGIGRFVFGLGIGFALTSAYVIVSSAPDLLLTAPTTVLAAVPASIVGTLAVVATPVVATPVVATPVEATPVEATPVVTTSVESAPVESTSGDAAAASAPARSAVRTHVYGRGAQAV